MKTLTKAVLRPKISGDYAVPTKHRNGGFALAAVGLVLVVIALIATIAAANSDSETGSTAAWAFGTTVLGFGTIKLAIGIVLLGILARIWFRAEAVKEACRRLRPDVQSDEPRGTVKTEFGEATETKTAPGPLPIHRMARRMWLPMLGMGYMLVLVGFVLSLVWAGKVDDGTQQAVSAWTQGTQFLGEGMLLAGISFLLGSILAALRETGGDVQESLGVPVRTLKMPKTVKLFVGFMALGLMISVVQFVLYAAVAGLSNAQSFAAWSAWLGPFREVGLGLLLVGIVLSLVAIGNVLALQYARVREIIATGK